jgi:UDP-glucose 4-epimerase
LKILVTGGLGYIGSHVTVLLLESGAEVVSIDNIDNSHIEVLEGIKAITGKKPAFELLDLKDKGKTQDLFKKHTDIDGVIHFAAHKAVGESVENPLKYYKNNIGGLLNLLESLCELSIPLIFSSSCTVYGQSSKLPIEENTPLKPPSSPYGYTKQIGEQIIEDSCKAHLGFRAILLRYFNPIGAHPSAKIGEYPKGTPQNLVPFLTQTAIGKRPLLKVFGSNYNTPDGTCIRDYIHIMDLAQAHIDSINYLISYSQKLTCEIFNVGTGQGVSVLKVIKAFENTTSESVPYKFSDPRKGDTVAAYADVKKINNQIGWKAKFSLKEALQSAWNWEKELDKKS